MPKQPPIGGKQPNMNDLLKQAQKMQEQLMAAQAAAAEQVVEGQSGGGVVKVTVSGGGEVRSVKIDPKVVDPEDVEMLEDLVLAALHEAMNKAAELSQQAMGGLDLGGLGGGLGGLLG
jgi:DNA-binding YbaB/EbfC family protein